MNVLVFEGPGTGEGPVLQRTSLRPDWEVVLKAIIDWALSAHGGGFNLSHGLLVYGFNGAGYFQRRCAVHEHRPHVYIISSPNHSLRESNLGMFPDSLRAHFSSGSRTQYTEMMVAG